VGPSIPYFGRQPLSGAKGVQLAIKWQACGIADAALALKVKEKPAHSSLQSRTSLEPKAAKGNIGSLIEQLSAGMDKNQKGPLLKFKRDHSPYD
jgi:hypothetical protein